MHPCEVNLSLNNFIKFHVFNKIKIPIPICDLEYIQTFPPTPYIQESTLYYTYGKQVLSLGLRLIPHPLPNDDYQEWSEWCILTRLVFALSSILRCQMGDILQMRMLKKDQVLSFVSLSLFDLHSHFFVIIMMGDIRGGQNPHKNPKIRISKM